MTWPEVWPVGRLGPERRVVRVRLLWPDPDLTWPLSADCCCCWLSSALWCFLTLYMRSALLPGPTVAKLIRPRFAGFTEEDWGIYFEFFSCRTESAAALFLQDNNYSFLEVSCFLFTGTNKINGTNTNLFSWHIDLMMLIHFHCHCSSLYSAQLIETAATM